MLLELTRNVGEGASPLTQMASGNTQSSAMLALKTPLKCKRCSGVVLHMWGGMRARAGVK